MKLVTLFGPEHGIRGEFDEKVGDRVDRETGLQVYSLYGERRVPTPEQLSGLDALVHDIQDIGCRPPWVFAWKQRRRPFLQTQRVIGGKTPGLAALTTATAAPDR